MPEPTSATFAVVSDLHCRLSTDTCDSFLVVGGLRNPSNRHPVQALLDLIDAERLTADALLLPGDLTNKGRREGLQQGWDYALEIGRALNVQVTIPVIGNHDIDSHRVHGVPHPFHDVRNLRPGFPFADRDKVQSFFSDGYCVLSIPGADIVAINTVIDHVDPASAKRGSFSLDRIARMETELASRLNAPLRGALMHHHPMLHTGTFLEDLDVIPTGDALLDSLRRLGCRFVIHGHKHFTRLSYVDGLAVLASGSFSAMLQEYATAVANTFHIIRVDGDNLANVRGTLRTWVFRFGSGWKRSNADHGGFPYLSGFGRTTPMPVVVQKLEELAAADAPNTRFLEPNVLEAVPDAKYLTPTERDQLNEELRSRDLKLSDSDDGRIELWRRYRA